MTQAVFDFESYGKLPAPLSWERPTAEILHGGDIMPTESTFRREPDSWTFRPLPPNPYRTNSQRYRIYNRLARYGRVKNVEILFGLGGPRIMNTTGRTSEIREFLKPFGFQLHCYPINNDGVYIYEVRP